MANALRGKGLRKGSQKIQFWSANIVVSIPLRGKGLRKCAAGTIAGLAILAVSIPLRGKGLRKPRCWWIILRWRFGCFHPLTGKRFEKGQTLIPNYCRLFPITVSIPLRGKGLRKKPSSRQQNKWKTSFHPLAGKRFEKVAIPMEEGDSFAIVSIPLRGKGLRK